MQLLALGSAVFGVSLLVTEQLAKVIIADDSLYGLCLHISFNWFTPILSAYLSQDGRLKHNNKKIVSDTSKSI